MPTSNSTLPKQMIPIPLESVRLEGELVYTPQSQGIVIFAHGAGSSRHSPRNQYVAGILQNAGIGTLLFDLLTEEEDKDSTLRFNISLLTTRLSEVTLWLANQPRLQNMPLGYFGASTGAAAALIAAAELGPKISCVVSRGGRPDLAENFLAKVRSPTLLIVGEDDELVLDLNQQVYKLLNVTKEIYIVPGATHLFDEPGTLEEVAKVATLWFQRYLKPHAREQQDVHYSS